MILATLFLVLLTILGGGNAQSCGSKRKMDCKDNCPGGNSVGHWRHTHSTDHGCCESFWSCFGTRKHCEFICDKCSKDACPAGYRYRHGPNHRTNKSGSARRNECCVRNVCKCDNGAVSSGTCGTNGAQMCARCNAGYSLNGGRCKANTCKCSNGKLGSQSQCARSQEQNCGSCNPGYKRVGKECKPKTCKCTNGQKKAQSACPSDNAENCGSCHNGFRLEDNKCFREYTYPASNAWVVIEDPTMLMGRKKIINLEQVTAFDSSARVVPPLSAEFNVDNTPHSPATNCINGNAGMCHSDPNGRDARLRIKYAADADIHRITVVNRKDCCTSRITGATIRVIAGGLTQWSDRFDGTRAEYTFAETEALVPAEYTRIPGDLQCKMNLGETREDAVDRNHCFERCTADEKCIAVTWFQNALSCVLHPVCDDQEKAAGEVHHIAPEIDDVVPCNDINPYCDQLAPQGFCVSEDPMYVETQCARTCGLCADRSALQHGYCNPNTPQNRISRDTGFRSLESCFKARCANVPNCAAVSFGASHADHSPECVAYLSCPSFKEDMPGYTTRMKALQKGTCKAHTLENVLKTFTDASLESCYEDRCADDSTCAAVSFEGTTCTTYKECTGVEPSNKNTKLKELRMHATAGICAGHDDDWTADDKPAGAKTWERHPGLGWRTGDRLSVNQCRQACHLQIGCGHFSVSNQFCYLFKGDPSDCDTSDNAPAWLEQYAHKTLMDGGGMICREKDLPLNEGGPLDQQMLNPHIPRDQCEALCMFDVRCRAFAWNRSSMQCHFKWGFDPNASNKGWGRKSHRGNYDFCYKPEVPGAPRQRTDIVGDFCWKHTYARGVGQFPTECPQGKEKIGALCYDKCPSGYFRASGTIDCHQHCPEGFRDDGLFCRPSGSKGTEYGRGVGYGYWWGKGGMERCEEAEGKGKCEWHGLLAYPKCDEGYENIACCICRRKMVDCRAEGMNPGLQWLGDTSCAKKLISGASSHSTLQCKDGMEKSWDGLCYRKCTEGYEDSSFACWGNPPKDWVNCGFGAARSEFHCAVVTATQTIKTLSVIWSWFVGPALGGGLEAAVPELLRRLGELDYNFLGNQALTYATNPANNVGFLMTAINMDLAPHHDGGESGEWKGQTVKFEDLSEVQQARFWMGMAESVDVFTGFVGAAQAFLYPTCDDMPEILLP